MRAALSSPQYPDFFYNTFHVGREVEPDDLVLKVDDQVSQARVLALYVPPYSPVRVRSEATLPVVDGKIQAEPANDIVYGAVVERHKQTGNIGLGFVSGFGLNGGTMASTLGSPTCNIICLGSNPEDMALAINHLASIGGGQVLVRDGEIVEEIRLPLGGFMADIPAREMADQERAITDRLHAWGCPIERPWLYLLFFEIVPLPEFALTEHGVVEFASLQYVNPVLEVLP
jgi:adenine deaminase